MMTQTTKATVPKLRFGEFTDGWHVKKLGDVAKFTKGKGVSKDDISSDGNTEAIRYGELYTRYDEVIDEVYSKTKLDSKSLVLSKQNDVIIPASGETNIDIATASCVLNSDIALSGDINIIRTDNNGIFLAYYLNNAKKLDIAKLAQGNSVVHLYSSGLKSLKLNLPAKPEQEKIAGFLTVVDERVELMQKRVDLLKKYKKGMMQKIFNQKIRFKDDNDNAFPDWQQKKISDILKERKLYAPKDGTYEHISLTTAGVVPKSERYERDFLVSSNNKRYRLTKLNDICYNPANLKFGVIARNKYKQGIFSPIYVTYEVKNANVDFVEYLVTRRDFIEYARKYEEGTVYERMAVNPNDLAKLDILLPHIEEQQKIAKFLTSLDDKIKAGEDKLTQAKNFKKSLLQRLFV